MLKETQVTLANVTSSSNGATKQSLKEEDDNEDEEEEGSVHDDSDEWSEEGDNLLKVCDNKNMMHFYLCCVCFFIADKR